MGASREMPRRGTRREVSRIAARGEVARIAGYRDLIRSRDQQGAARRRQSPEPHNLAHKMKRELATIPTNTQVIGGRNLFMALRPVGKDRCSHTSVSLTGDFLRSAKLRRSLAHQIKHSLLVNGRNNRSVTIKQASNSLDSPRAVGSGVRFLRQATSEPLMYARDEKFCISSDFDRAQHT